MTRRTKWIVGSLAGALVVAGVAVSAVLASTDTAFEGVHEGMTRDQVVTAVGRAADATQLRYVSYPTKCVMVFQEESWHGRRSVLRVVYDSVGTVIRVERE